MATQGPQAPLVGVTTTGTGSVAWTNTQNILSSNNVYASAILNSSPSNYLYATSFGFTLASGSTINGITVVIERSVDSTLFACSDSRVRIVKLGVVGATERAITGTWTTADSSITYGSATDLWGETWTVADVNSSNFGVVISAIGGTADDAITPKVDYMSMTVDYTEPPASATSLTANPYLMSMWVG